ncbi:molecular chaperone [Candidatus Deferrimicrobium sp.]|uniref:fimbrial biogenesis chaperone n=1 Tax=Candidatus Deferrimicrobium sp. TaxID=3060586 RepID=UPI002717AB2B|nr:fimbria/pilus periplasmic chaperone [Candidatus Deferrimicrobium sp.]MDO8737509.1 fimbria/pilus periplasmic chaperone [Candidatus Deferrimicrobium sp.]
MKRPEDGRAGRVARRSSATVFLFLLLLPVSARAGDWRVSPIRLDLGRDAKSGAVTVANDSDDRLQVQMKAYEWTQDAEGKDRYEETGEILFFPRLMILERKEEKILRAGIRIPAVAKEKTFRLFIEEIPGPRKAEGVNVAVAIRFGVPIFVKPLKEEARGEVGAMTMSAGALLVPVTNTGNVHFIVQSVLVRGRNGAGEEIFSRELSGWYLLAGVSRGYMTTIPPGTCGNMAVIEAEVKTDKLPLRGRMVVDRSMCGP